MQQPVGPITIDTPLASGTTVAFRSMQASEALGRPFEYVVEILSDDPSVKLSDVLGQKMTVHLEVGDTPRHFNGYVTEFAAAGTAGNFAVYRTVLRPWLWLLTRTFNCRIYQDKTVPDIIKAVFRDNGFTDFEESLNETYPARTFVVQYRESDFNFVSRLMEQAGIYYYFKHTESKHTLVLSDSLSAHEASPTCKELPYQAPDENRAGLMDYVDSWSRGQSIQPGAYALAAFDFERPSANLAVQLNAPKEHAQAAFEVFDYPGVYLKLDEGEAYAKVRLQQAQSLFDLGQGRTNARGFAVGNLWSLIEHPREEDNREYLIVAAHYSLAGQDLQTGTWPRSVYDCSFQVMDSKLPFRTPPSAEKPIVHGPQTAIVVGKSGEEIWTDEYGRVKVQFHWDRFAKGDETSSCWIRVAQLWAGTKWGGIHIPRMGQEVIVEFLEGDPDRPIITGRVYNNDNKVPYDLPANQTQSGVKSRSTKGGADSNFNEIRFEDKKGAEELHIQAERDKSVLIKRNHSVNVGASRSVSVGGAESYSVTGARSVAITGPDTQNFANTRTMTVDKADTLTVTGQYTSTYHGGSERTVEKLDKLTVDGANKETTVHGEYNVVADTHFKLTQGSDEMLMENKFNLKSAGEITLDNGDCRVELKSGKIALTAGTEISLSCGGSSITLKQDGTIEIAGGMKVSLTGGAGSIELAQAGATMSGPKATVSGAGSTEITGAVVKIN
jgi:type VI secretion system secreted protein VgrG